MVLYSGQKRRGILVDNNFSLGMKLVPGLMNDAGCCLADFFVICSDYDFQSDISKISSLNWLAVLSAFSLLFASTITLIIGSVLEGLI